MPDSLELPRMLGAVIPLMSGKGVAGLSRGVVHELVALAFGHSPRPSGRLARRCPWLHPGFAPIIGALNNLSEPSTALRRINSIRING